MGLRCKRCGSGEHVRNGLMRGRRRYLCKACGLDLTDTPPRGMPLRVEATAVLPRLGGPPTNRTAKLPGVSTPGVMTRIERFARAFARRPGPEGRAVVVGPDGMWRFLERRPTSPGSGRPGIVLQGEWLTGNAGVVTPAP